MSSNQYFVRGLKTNMRGEIRLKINICFVILMMIGLLHTGCTSMEDDEAGRTKRQLGTPFLAFPFGGAVKMILGVGIPITIPGRALAYGQNIQFQYPLPSNISYFTNYLFPTIVRRRRSTPSDDRATAYRILQQQFDRNGVDGKKCIMRGICEVAETPIEEEGFVGELLHFLLTPDYGDNANIDVELLNAKIAGERGENCTELYSACPMGYGILDHVSTVDYV